jgi:threonine/homoserine/homoserine lactone efflux protein
LHIFDDLLGLITITALGALSPGPNLALVIKNALTRSHKYAMLTTFGIITSLSIQIILCILGLDLVINRHPESLHIIRIIGGIYLLYLSLQSFKQSFILKKNTIKSRVITLLPNNAGNKSFANNFATGFMCNSLNINATLFILFLFSIIITPNLTLIIKALYAATMILTTLICLSTIAFLISRPQLKKLFAKSQAQINILFAIILAIFGILILNPK